MDVELYVHIKFELKYIMDIYKIVIDENSGMDAIALVEFPATECEFLKFAKEDYERLTFDEDRHIVTGVVMLADTPIKRFDATRGEYAIVFEKDTIEKMMIKYAKEGKFNNVNLEHCSPKIEGVFLYESYIYNNEKGICPRGIEATEGSWIGSFKVENEEIWNEIKEGKLRGFSLEGIFELEKEETEEDKFNKYLDEILKDE